MPEHEAVDLLRDLALIMVLAGVATLVFHRLRQPVILGYLLAGVAVSPFTPPPFFVRDPDTVSTLADLGVILLMFSLGLEFSLFKLRRVGTVALIGGAIQVLIVFTLGYRAGLLLGWGTITSLFLACALSISSTAVIAKALGEQRRLDDPASQAVIGILVFEDFAAIVMIAVLAGLAVSDLSPLRSVGPVLVNLGAFLAASGVLGRFVVPWLFKQIEETGRLEILVVSGLALCFGLAMFSRSLGLSVAAGAFIAGTLIAESGRNEKITSAIAPIREMFSALFFVAIGMLFNPAYLGDYWPHILILTALLIAGKVLAGSTATFLLGYSHRAALQAGMSLAQIGEFSLIIVKIGQDEGAVPPFLYPVIVGVTVLSTLTTPYLIGLSGKASAWLDQILPTRFAKALLAIEISLDQIREGGAYRIGVREKVQRHFTGMIAGLSVFAAVVITARALWELKEAIGEAIGLPVSTVVAGLSMGVILIGIAALVMIVRQLADLARAVGQVRQGGWRLRAFGEWSITSVVSRNAVALVIVTCVVVVLELFLPSLPGLWFVPILVLALGLIVAYAILWDSFRTIRRRLESSLLPGQDVGPKVDKP